MVTNADPVVSATAPTRCRQLIRSGDTVFSTVRPYLERIAYIDESLDREFASTGFCVLRPTSDLDPRYLFHYASSPLLLDQVLPLQKGVSYPAVLDKEVRGATLPIPPLDEQRRIVAILEDHLSRLDAATASVAAAKRRSAALLEQHVVELLLGARGERAKTALLGSELPPLPQGWRWNSLGGLADVVGGVTKDTTRQSDRSIPEVPYLRVANVQRGRLDLDRITMIRVPAVRAAQLELRPGDVLLNEGGDRDKLARGWVWEGQIAGCIHQNHVFRARPALGVVDPYWLAWLANTLGGPWAERHGKQSVNLASISLSTIKRMPVPLPPLSVQKSLLADISQLSASLAHGSGELISAQSKSGLLRRSLLAAAFRGDLTRGARSAA